MENSTESTGEINSLSELSPIQIKSGIAAWLGWLFDGLDGTLYLLVAAPFVAELLHTTEKNKDVGVKSAFIQAAFLIGWAIGGAVFGRIGDKFGRSRTICFTILTYALFTGLSSFAANWQMLLVFRFLAALGIGGEWAAGSSLISETWPRHWRPWVSAVLQSAYQCGLLLASVASFFFVSNPRYVFLVGAVPALLVFWIRRNIPEPDEWHREKLRAKLQPKISDLFRGEVLKTTILTILVCSAALTTIWAFLFWSPQQLRALPDLKGWSKEQVGHYVSQATMIATIVAIMGNFCSGALARYLGYRKAAAIMFLGGLITLFVTYHFKHNHIEMLFYLPFVHFFVQGIFGLFPMYIPPLFPTLLRTTGAGFCYNIGRVVAAVGTVVFVLLTTTGGKIDISAALVYVSYIYIPAIFIAFLIPEPASQATVNVERS